MKRLTNVVVLVALLGAVAAAAAPPPIEKVEIVDRAFRVNGRPFLPIMAWLQDANKFPLVVECGMNATAGYWSTSSGTKDVTEYLPLVAKAGLYGVMPFDVRLKGHPALLGYIHDDEPDLPHEESDAEVVPAAGLKINPKTPLWKMLDGVTHSWSVLDPLQGAAVTIRLKQPVTVTALAVHLTISPGLAVAKEVVFEGDGKEILKATLDAKTGPQKFDLPGPATFRALAMTVRSTYPGDNEWGSVGEIEGFDASGKNVLAAPPRDVPRATPGETLEKYKAMKAGDASRPGFMTFTGYFHPHFSKYTDAEREALYGAYIRAADVVGYDIYPIYGWNKPEWIYLVYDATRQLTAMAGTRPVYAWIETSKGGQYTGSLEDQKAVTPQHIRAEVWMAVTGGATAIGYFTHVWKPAYHQFGVPEENRKALRAVNDQLTRLAPAILGKVPARPAAVGAGDVKLAALTREHDGRLYVFAVNYDERLKEAGAVFEIAGLKAGAAVEVVDEDRTLRAADGRFTDTFAPLAVHIYRIAP
ncbi:MAG TPA: hypothetical protein VM431_00305 [Phycisphaerae bacterium]|nr:hypothetical protein [Phycisphaerae bacterium]